MSGGEQDEPIIPPLDDRAGPARRVSQRRIAAMVGAAFAAVEGEAVPDAEPARAARGGGQVVKLVGGIALGFALAGAAAALWYGVGPGASVPPPAEEPEVPEPAAPLGGGDDVVADDVRSEETDPEVAADDEEQAPAVVRRVPEEPASDEPPEDLPPDDLLRRANALRGERRWADAERTYQLVIARHPGSRQAYIATVAAAALRLHHLNDTAEAVRLYQSALADRPDGFLREEASYGLAASYRTAGDHQRELDALRRFVSRHPDSLRRSQAEARIVELTTAGAETDDGDSDAPTP